MPSAPVSAPISIKGIIMTHHDCSAVGTSLFKIVSEKDSSYVLEVTHSHEKRNMCARITQNTGSSKVRPISLCRTAVAPGGTEDDCIKAAFDAVRNMLSEFFFNEILPHDERLDCYLKNDNVELTTLCPDWVQLKTFYTMFSRDIMKDVWIHPTEVGKFDVKHVKRCRVGFADTVLHTTTEYRYSPDYHGRDGVSVNIRIFPSGTTIINGNITLTRMYNRKADFAPWCIVKEPRNAKIIDSWLSTPCDEDEILQGRDPR